MLDQFHAARSVLYLGQRQFAYHCAEAAVICDSCVGPELEPRGHLISNSDTHSRGRIYLCRSTDGSVGLLRFRPRSPVG